MKNPILVLILLFFSILKALGAPGGFLLYFGFGIIGFIVIFLVLPETKSIPLEQIPTLLDRGWCIPCLPVQYEQFDYEEDTQSDEDST